MSISHLRANERIRATQVRLIDAEGTNHGIVPLAAAMLAAREAGLDLVEVAPDAEPPVVRIADFGKMKYEATVSARESRKHQRSVQIKEMKLRPKIDDHDFGTKAGHVRRFLEHGDKVKVTIMFRGREQSRPETGARLLERLAADMADVAVIESAPRLEGRNMLMILSPRPARP